MADSKNEAEQAQKLERAAALESKMLYVKAAQIYIELGLGERAALAYEKGGDFAKAEAIFEKLGKSEEAARCKKAREAAANPQTWQDLQSEFQNENPY